MGEEKVNKEKVALSIFSTLSSVNTSCNQFESNDMIPNGTILNAEVDVIDDDENEESTESSVDSNQKNTIIQIMKERSMQSPINNGKYNIYNIPKYENGIENDSETSIDEITNNNDTEISDTNDYV